MTVDELRKAKQALDADLSQIIGDRLIAFQESAGGLIPGSVVVGLHFYELLSGPKKLLRCEVSTDLRLW